MPTVLCRIKDYIQPFERQLALRELRALCPGPLSPVDGPEQTASIFSVVANGSADALREGLTYWRSVGHGDDDLTLQVRVEATSLVGSRNGSSVLAPNGSACAINLPRRRCLRYATHGMHEYRGKFFPQLARALINIAGVPSNGIVVDPMCGSGTTLVEARLAGRSAYGLDMNPLSVFVARVKCQALSIPTVTLQKAYLHVEWTLAKSNSKGHRHTDLPANDQDYLRRWYALPALHELDQVYAAIQTLSTAPLRDFFLVCLSNVLRSVSWQKNDDLRVRKEVVDVDRGEVTRRFLSQARRSTTTVSAFTAERGRLKAGGFDVSEADARDAVSALKPVAGKVDAVITSPPYATALPYIDTDRLSLIYLGLLSRTDHATRDRLMIGNREVSSRMRDDYWDTYTTQKRLLPTDTRRVIDRVHRLNSENPAGFRRRNLAALLSKYFFDMREVLLGIRGLLRPCGDAFLVVGNNRTTAGGQLIHIRTADHLSAIAQDLRFDVVESLSMDMLPSRDIFRKNAVPSERIIRLKAPDMP